MKIRIPRLSGGIPGDERIAEAIPHTIDNPPEKVPIHIDSSLFLEMLADIATNAWRAQSRLNAWPQQEEAVVERKRLERNVDAILSSLEGFGVRVKDHTGEAYDYGQALKVVAAQPQEGIDREIVTETIRPTVIWNEITIQRAEIVIATPKEREG